MRFYWGNREDDGLSAIRAERGVYDGTPIVDSFVLGTSPERINANLVAVAGTLAFEAFISDEVSMDAKVLPLVGEGLVNFFHPRVVRTPVIDYKAQRILEGRGRLIVQSSYAADNTLKSETTVLGDFTVKLTDNTESPRGYAHDGVIYLPSNARYVTPRQVTDSRCLYPEVAAALLITGELGSRWIHFDRTGYAEDDQNLVRARRLLRTLNRELSWH